MTEPVDWNEVAEVTAASTVSDPVVVGASYGRTDWDNGRRLSLYEGANLRYVNDLDEWYQWDNDRWIVAQRGDLVGAAARTVLNIQNEVQHIEDEGERGQHSQWARRSLSEGSLTAMVRTAAGLPELRVHWNDFDQNGHLLNFPNCTLDPLTLKWHPHVRSDMLTQVCPTSYDPKAESNRLSDFLLRFLPDKEERQYTLEVLASCALSWGNAQRQLVMLLGPTSTGKSTLMDLVKRTLGDDYVSAVNVSVFRGNLDDKPRPDLLRAVKTRLVVAFEGSERWELHADQVKRMTGGDPITARSMQSNVMRESVASFVPWIVANEPPSIVGSDNALRRRLVGLRMDAAVDVEEDDGRLRSELVGDERARRALLALLIHTYYECGGRVVSPMPPKFIDQTMEMFTQLDDVFDVLQSLKDEGSLKPIPLDTPAYHCIRSSQLYRCYALWVKRHGTPKQNREMLGQKHFSQRIRSLGYEIERSRGTRIVGWELGRTTTTFLLGDIDEPDD